MEVSLRCNRQTGHYCRAALTEHAVVTTCSHIFCMKCAKELGLDQAAQAHRTCPTCNSPLPAPDDAAHTFLKPSEEYKTSVLSGFDPSTIIECAGRALAFWTYQTTQEILYQEFMGKGLTQKYTHLSKAMDDMVKEANSEIDGLQSRVDALHMDQKSLQEKNAQLVAVINSKDHRRKQIQVLYDKLKQQVMMGQVRTAASDTINYTLDSLDVKPRSDANNLMGGQQTNAGTANDGQAQYMVHRNSFEAIPNRQRTGSESQHSLDAVLMPPPAKSFATDHFQPVSDNTPMHRTHLPGTVRATANRSQIPLSTSRNQHQAPTGSQYIPRSGSRTSGGHNSLAMPGSHRGITSHMKMGTASNSHNHIPQDRAGLHRSHLTKADDRHGVVPAANGFFYR